MQSFKPLDSKDPIVYATGTDKIIRELTRNQVGAKGKEEKEKEELKEKELTKYEQSVTLNQIAIMHNRRAFFCGVAEQKKPGSIQVLGHPFSKNC